MSNEAPAVTAVMITQNRERHRYVMMSVRAFLNQTYPMSRLLIVNDGVPVGIGHPRIREIMLPFKPEHTLGELRNVALDHVDTPLAIQWDDDDWSRPDRIATQVAGCAPGRAVLLKNQFRYDLGTGECRDVSFPHGIDGTILHPVDANRYPPWRRGEDSLFANLWRRAAKLTAVDNDPGLYVRLYTGHNTWSRAHVMSAGKSVADQDGLGAMLGDLNAACPASGVF